MFDEILNFDKNLFLFLNNLGSNNFDFLWIIISSKYLNILVFSFFSLFFIYYHTRVIKVFYFFIKAHT